MTERVYRCPNCGAVKTIDQKEADGSRVLQGEIPAFIVCMVCPDKHHHWERVRVWGDGVKDRNKHHYNMFGTRGKYVGFNRKTRRAMIKAVKSKARRRSES